MSLIPPAHERKVLIGLAAVLAVQIPTTIQQVSDAFVRSCLLVVALLIVVLLSWKAPPP